MPLNPNTLDRVARNPCGAGDPGARVRPFCPSCLTNFKDHETYARHIGKGCDIPSSIEYVIPKDTVKKFSPTRKGCAHMTRPSPIIGFLDTESFNRPVHVINPDGKKCKVVKYGIYLWTVQEEGGEKDYNPHELKCALETSRVQTEFEEEGDVLKFGKETWTVQLDSGSIEEHDPYTLMLILENGFKMKYDPQNGIVASDRRTVLSTHEMSCWAVVIVSRFPYTDHLGRDDTIHYYTAKQYDDKIQSLADCLKRVSDDIEDVFKKGYKTPDLTTEQEADFESATTCIYCQEPFVDPKELTKQEATNKRKVRAHDHWKPPKEHYIGASHCDCDIKDRYTKKLECGKTIMTYRVPIFCHNLKYGQAEILNNVDKFMPPWQKSMEAISQTINNLITFQIGIFQFKDSLRFLAGSLDKLVATLKPQDFKAILKHPAAPKDSNGNPDVTLFTQKGIEGHSMITGEHVLEGKEPFTKDDLYSNLTGKRAKDRDFEHYINFWTVTKAKSKWENYVNYCLSDTLLLADVYMQFSGTKLVEYGVDPATYLSLADFSSGSEYAGRYKKKMNSTPIRPQPRRSPLFEDAWHYHDWDSHRFKRGGISGVFRKQ